MSQNVSLTDSQVPSTPDPSPHKDLAGNWADDDALAIDQYFEAADQAPERFDGLRVPQEEIPAATRLLGGRFNFSEDTPLAAVCVLPPDLRRKHIYLSVISGGDGVSLIMDSDPFSWDNTISTAPGNFYYNPMLSSKATWILGKGTGVPQSFTIDDHTGPLWVGVLGLIEQGGSNLVLGVATVSG